MNDSDSAFPVPDGRSWGVKPSKGMSIRDYFAGQALNITCTGRIRSRPDDVARRAYEIADAMISIQSRR